MHLGNTEWAALAPQWRAELALSCMRAQHERRPLPHQDEPIELLARSWADHEQLSAAQLAAVRRVLRTQTKLVVGSLYDRARWTLEPLSWFTSLCELELQREHLEPTDLEFIARVPTLRHLTLEVYGDTGHHASDLRTLACSSALESLQTTSLPLVGVDALAELTQLRTLKLVNRGSCSVLAPAPSRVPVERLRKLERLCIGGRLGHMAPIQPDELVGLGQLQQLALCDSPSAPIHTASGLASLTRLRGLDLSSTNLVTLGGLIEAPLELLEYLWIPSSVPEAEVCAFERVHPRCDVMRVGVGARS